MLVVAEPDGGDDASSAGEKCIPGTEVVVLVFDFARPVLGEQVFETAADCVAIATTSAVCKGAAAETIGEAGVSPGITALDVNHRGTPRVAKAAGDRTESAVDEGIVVRVEKAVVGFKAQHPVR